MASKILKSSKILQIDLNPQLSKTCHWQKKLNSQPKRCIHCIFSVSRSPWDLFHSFDNENSPRVTSRNISDAHDRIQHLFKKHIFRSCHSLIRYAWAENIYNPFFAWHFPLIIVYRSMFPFTIFFILELCDKFQEYQ